MRHKTTLLGLLAIGMFVLIGGTMSEAQPPAPEPKTEAGWKLVWADEFDTNGPPDPKKWIFEQGFVRNEEHQWYQPDNAFCENGFLIIEGRREKEAQPQL